MKLPPPHPAPPSAPPLATASAATSVFACNPTLPFAHDPRPAFRAPRSAFRTSRPAFTLIEILVTISIITLLAGITIPVALSFLGNAEASSTRAMLNALGTAASEYNILTGSVVPHKDQDAFGNRLDLDVGQPQPNGGSGSDLTLGYFVKTAGQVPNVARLIGTAAKANLQNLDANRPVGDVAADAANPTYLPASFQILDAWDNPIRYAGGVDHGDTFNDDDYLPAHPNAFFASAGPDGLWGSTLSNSNSPDPSIDNDNDGEPDAADNLYSFDVD